MFLKLFLIALVLEECFADRDVFKFRIARCKCRCREIRTKNKATSSESSESSQKFEVLTFDGPLTVDNNLCLLLEPKQGRIRLEFTDVHCRCKCKKGGKKSKSSSSSSSSSSSNSESGPVCEDPTDPLKPVMALDMNTIEGNIISGPAKFEVKGDPTIIPGGVVGTAVEFDTLGDTECLFDMVPSSSSSSCPVDPSTCSNGFTVAAWVRDVTPNDGFVFTFSQTNSVRVPAGALIVSAGTTQYLCPLVTINLQDGNWHHLVFIHNTPDTTQPRVIVDNVEVTSSCTNTMLPADTYDDLRFKLGCQMASGATGPSRGYDGQMDEVRLYDRQLSSTEIQDLFNAGAP